MEVAVDIKRQIQSLFNEAEAYRSHGLFVEAKEKYNRLVGMCGTIAEVAAQTWRPA